MMELPSPAPADSPDGTGSESGSVRVSEAAIRRLADAVARLANDPEYFVEALTDMLMAMKPISMERLSANEVRFLIESGAFSADEWAETSAAVDRGSLQVGATEGWLLGLFETSSMEVVTGFLDWNEQAVRAAVEDGRLYAIEISGRLRFPTWQFSRSPERLLPGLTEIIRVVTSRWNWQSVAGFMATPQSSLVAEGRQTPVEWLRDGGDLNDVIEIIEASDWS
ncbi:hypothetical protein E3O55_09895 [Cryobacterium sp. MDB1-18-2]|uniref:hypothetical protein n=1 Tax=unclassified Cryobacterium TaxID=2649013 RepID=UPI001069F2C9|nr:MULTISPECIES: hypothetical protein [unclassified Cryobacterium]TFC29177.1 hypothetical protein E3O55_09895 [Cryobacterium sp. MDB1-18-2]TFC45539.1 hypothetical protein E3O50_03565 [Cryobacterium sp. MDB1-18-1]